MPDKQPIIYQRVEAGFLFILALYLYFYLQFHLVWFVVFLFSVDIFMLGYLKNKSIGAQVYNIGHTLFIPATLLILGVYNQERLLIAAGIIWAAHIGLDRALGYGLKFSSGFKDTHLGHIGKL